MLHSEGPSRWYDRLIKTNWLLRDIVRCMGWGSHPVAKMTSVRVLISLADTCGWPLHQLGVKNSMHHYLEETKQMEQQTGFFLVKDRLGSSTEEVAWPKQCPRA